MKLPAAVHHALVADTARAMARKTPAVAQAAAQIRAEENRRLLETVPTTAFDMFVPDAPETKEFVGVDQAKGNDLSCEVRAHMEGPVLVVDQIHHYCPEHAFTPPEFSGLAFCPYCEFPDLVPAEMEGATP